MTFSVGNRPTTSGELGFTLLELLVVMVIAIAVVTIAVPQFSRSIDSVRLHQAARESAALLRISRNAAIAYSRPVAVEIDAGERHLTVAATGRSYELPPQVSVSFPDDSYSYLDDHRTIVFNVDGTSSGGRLALGTDRRSQHITVDWLTGRVSIE